MYPLPSWVYDTVIYQIFPDRFHIGKGLKVGNKRKLYEQRGGKIESWDIPPKATEDNSHCKVFYGGDLWGITEKLNYIKALGVNCIYLNPIFLSPSNHKYDTVDHFKIDPQFGTKAIFKKLLKECKRNKIRLILDGVFNHVSSQHPWFIDAINGKREAISLFTFFKDGYVGWYGSKSMPQIDLENTFVRDYVLRVIEHYLTMGVDGWRLDCGHDLGPVNNSVITAKAKEISSESYIVSEIWSYPAGWNMVDGIMNYHFANCIYAYLKGEMKNIASVLESTYLETKNIYGCWNMLDSHDTERLATAIENKDLRKIAIVMQFTYPGVPVIYYGTEIGMKGGRDPECRAPMIWEEEKWDLDLLNFYRKLITIRKQEPALRFGTFKVLCEDPLVYLRKTPYPLHNMVIAINKDSVDKKITVSLTDGKLLAGQFVDLFTMEEFPLVSGTLKLKVKAKSFAVLKMKYYRKQGYDQYRRIH